MMTRMSMAATALSLSLAAGALAQNAQVPVVMAHFPPKVKIVFPEGVHHEKASMTYGLHHTTGGYSRSYGNSMASGASSFEIAAVWEGEAVDRFKALVWAPGCKMKKFDVAVGASDIELQFACDPLKSVTLMGRVKPVDKWKSAKVSAEYTSDGTCFFMMEDCTGGCPYRCGGPQIVDIAAADVAADGTFKIELPDFSADPIAFDDPSAGIELRLNQFTLLRPESTFFQSQFSDLLRITPSYPAEVIFVPR